MIITMKNGSRIDYGVFAVEHPFMDIIAIKSSDYHTPLSGDEPAFLVMGTATGEIYQTKDFVAVDESFAEFFITDQKLIDTLLPKTSIYYNKIHNVGIVSNDDGWSLFVEFEPALPEEQEPYAFLELPSVFWTTGERLVIDKSVL